MSTLAVLPESVLPFLTAVSSIEINGSINRSAWGRLGGEFILGSKMYKPLENNK